MIRTTKPTSNDLYFITNWADGYSSCIQGAPTDSQCNVLANCVGYACGAFNEELALGYEKYHLNCNAENFIERAIASGLSVVKTPTAGSILCWEGAGSLAGHVAIVIEVINENCIRTAESAYGGSPFYVTTRYNNNGRWGMNANYTPRGFIVNPNYPVEPVPEPPTPNTYYKVTPAEGLWLLDENGTKIKVYPEGTIVKFIQDGYSKYGYHYYNIEVYETKETGYMASEYLTKTEEPQPEPPKPEPTPVERKFSVGQTVIFTGVLYGDSFGNYPGQSRENYVTTIGIVSDNANATKPYNIGDQEGWVAEEDLTLYVEPPKPEPTPEPQFKVGDWVVPTRLVDYYGTNLHQWDDEYEIVELVGDRAVLSPARGGIWAAMNIKDLKKVR